MNEDDGSRESAVQRLKAKRDFKSHLVLYLLLNALLIAIWTVQGVGPFWPIWPIMGWGIGLAFNAWTVYFQKPISENEIRQEMQRGE